MPTWLRELLIAAGGGTIVLVGVLTVFKNLFLKFFETGIESTFEKSIEKYKNKLTRSSKAYEILLDREMRFYERIESTVAELIPLTQDLPFYLKPTELIARKESCEIFREHMIKCIKICKTLKNETLIHQVYIPESVFLAFSIVVKQVQDNMPYWYDMNTLLFNGEYEKIDYDKGEHIVDDLLMKIETAEVAVKKRLEELSQLS